VTLACECARFKLSAVMVEFEKFNGLFVVEPKRGCREVRGEPLTKKGEPGPWPSRQLRIPSSWPWEVRI
jgi:hypothetical protein